MTPRSPYSSVAIPKNGSNRAVLFLCTPSIWLENAVSVTSFSMDGLIGDIFLHYIPFWFFGIELVNQETPHTIMYAVRRAKRLR